MHRRYVEPDDHHPDDEGNILSQCLDREALPYVAAHADARRRMAEGQQQVYCLLCRRWRWPDELCQIAQVRTEESEVRTEESE